MPFGIQPIHIVLIIVVALLIFGPKRLPDMGRSIGKSISEFRKGAKEMTDGFREEVGQPGTTQAAAVTFQPLPISSLKESVTSPESLAAPANRFCIQCGAPNLTEARFCSACGAKLTD